MKTTYNQTFTISKEKLQNATVKVFVYNDNKYTGNVTDEKKVEYTGVTSWDIIQGGEEVKQIEAETDENSADPNHEYLVLHFNDGSATTFRNSYVDMFIR